MSKFILPKFYFVIKYQKGDFMKTYNKLVRDNIPQIIENNGGKPKTKILSNDEYIAELNKKLCEECQEYIESEDIEELADICEVVYALIKAKNYTMEQFEKIRLDKVKKRGAFSSKIFLESVDE